MAERAYRQAAGIPLTRESLGIPNSRDRYHLMKRIISTKLDRGLVPVMRKHDIDMWITFGREFNTDPILPVIGGGFGGVRNVYIMYDNGSDKPEKIFIGSHEHREDLYRDVYDTVKFYGYDEIGLRPHLAEAVQQRNPKRIGINVSKTLPMADGLTWTLRNYLEEAIGPTYAERLVSAELLIRDFLGARQPEEYAAYRRLCEWTLAWCLEAFSARVVTPGITTTADIHWWMRDKAMELGFGLEFLPGMRINRQGRPVPTNSPDEPILPGDIVTMDAGLAFDLLKSDYQRTAYVLHPHETEAPKSLQKAFADALRVRDKVIENIAPGKIAHKIWDETMEWAQGAGYEVMYPAAGGRNKVITQPQAGIYSHSIGNFTHGIGARIAVDWPVSYGDRVRYPMGLGEWYSIELGVSTPIPEWDGRTVFVGIEEDVALTERGIEFFAQPQEQLILIPS